MVSFSYVGALEYPSLRASKPSPDMFDYSALLTCSLSQPRTGHGSTASGARSSEQRRYRLFATHAERDTLYTGRWGV